MSIPAYRIREAQTSLVNLRCVVSDLSDEQLKQIDLMLANAVMSVNLETFHREKEKLDRLESVTV